MTGEAGNQTAAGAPGVAKKPLWIWLVVYLIWGAILIPFVLLVMWFWGAEWTWKQFAINYTGMAVLLLLYEALERRVEDWLKRRRERRVSNSEH